MSRWLAIAACLSITAGTPPSAEEAELGKSLFFEKRLSFNGTMSCATCHDPEQGMGDGKRFSAGASGKTLKRHTPHLYNLARNGSFFWDGRAKTLEEQALMPIESADEMNSPLPDVIRRLKDVPYYAETFARVFPKKGLTAATLARAIAAFERTLVSKDSAYDRGALSDEAARGMKLFFGRAQCGKCHSGPNFTDGQFHNTGVPGTDLGRAAVDRVGEFQMRPYPFFQMQRAFKTPGLRNVALTAPYFHDGSEATLLDVVRFYDQGGKDRDAAGLSPDVRPLKLSEREQMDLVRFLESLTAPVKVERPPER